MAVVCFVSQLTFIYSQTTATLPRDPASESGLIHYGDLIDVDVVGNLDGDWRGTIDPEGFLRGLVYAPDPIFALCRTEQDVAAGITAQYSRTLRDPKVVVRVLDRSGRAAALLLGAVRNQQRFKINRVARLNELLALSGGITDTASGEITIARPGNLNCFAGTEKDTGKVSVTRVSITRLLAGEPEANPVILSGDIVTVTEAPPIYVIGGVNTPRQISSREELTLSRAILSAGGLSKEGVESDITIYRRDGSTSRPITVDLKKVLSKSQNDPILKPLDIVDVGQKGRAKPKFAPNVYADQLSRDIFKLPVRSLD